jgi:hypothetical protein
MPAAIMGRSFLHNFMLTQKGMVCNYRRDQGYDGGYPMTWTIINPKGETVATGPTELEAWLAATGNPRAGMQFASFIHFVMNAKLANYRAVFGGHSA